ncbi:hypothetical protein C8T65DRAFT_698845 [Cerioporus squamosus]|nr:hypothetical protein C8T65DRAFT_698845 [Cerioporus squamosus]
MALRGPTHRDSPQPLLPLLNLLSSSATMSNGTNPVLLSFDNGSPASTQTTRRSRSPIVLVPSTPSSPGQVPIATDDEITPPRPNQLTPRSYAQVAARPAAASNVVVWPVNTVLAAVAGPRPQLAAAANVSLSGPVTTGTDGSPPIPSTPVLRPVRTQVEDITDVIELPPPALPWSESSALTFGQMAAGGDRLSPLLPSSPIYVPSTASVTPTPASGTSTLRGAPRTFGTASSQGMESYDGFWAHFHTPSLPDSNLPSALQTPRALAPQTNGVSSTLAWPLPESSAGALSLFDASNVENVPLSTVSLEGHPPVASRTRKRRRGVTPGAGERVRKSVKRKGKARATEVSPGDGSLMELENPWTSSSARPHAVVVPRDVMPPPFVIPSQTMSSMNVTPYSDFSRTGSSTTSFRGLFNQSGSYPTPHAVSESSASISRQFSVLSEPLQRQVGPTQSPISLISRLSSATIERHSMDVDASVGALQSPSALDESVRSRPSMRDSGMDIEPDPTSRPRSEDRLRLRHILSDPRSIDERPVPYRQTSVEEIPEDGELGWGPLSTRSSTYDWSAAPSPSRLSSHAGGNRLQTTDDASIRGRLSESPWMPHARGGAASSRTFPVSSERGYAHDWTSMSPRRMELDERNARRRSSRQALFARGSPPNRLLHGQHPVPYHAAPSNPTPSARIRSLDIFDVGDDDNLPEAVRRGGVAAEDEEERPTPIAREGDPEVHRHDPESHFRGMSDNWVQELWTDPTDTSIMLNTFNPRFSRSYGTNRRTASDLRRHVGSITGESNFRIIAPDQAPSYRGRGPMEWAVTGLSREGVERILRRRVWSFRSITFLPHRPDLEIPSWLLALEGFLEDNVANIETAVRSTFERPQVRERIEQMLRANPEYNGIPTDEAFRRVMATLRVTVYTLDNDTVVANVFLRSPTQSVRVWRRWIQELRELTFGSYRTAIARARRVSACAGCLGVDHPSHLCPFPQMAGWNGPETAGGPSYSVDGRELRSRQAAMSQPP